MYRKPTHTDQYLHWDSNHHITAKHSVYNTLAHKAKTVSSTQESFDKELSHIKSALQHCQFPNWALNQWEYKFKHPNQPPNANPTNTNNNQDNNNKYKTTIVVPYIPQTADKFKRICKAKNIQVQFRGTNTLRTTLVNPKDKDHKSKQTGVIYQYQCPHVQCSSSYIGESGRSLGDRVKEHLKAPPPYTYTVSPQDTQWTPTNSTSYTKKSKTSPGQSKKPCLYMYKTPPQSQHWQIPTTSHLGPTTTVITNIPTQTNLTMLPTSTPPTGSPLTPPPPLATQVGGILIFLTFILIGKYTCTPPFIYI